MLGAFSQWSLTEPGYPSFLLPRTTAWIVARMLAGFLDACLSLSMVREEGARDEMRFKFQNQARKPCSKVL